MYITKKLFAPSIIFGAALTMGINLAANAADTPAADTPVAATVDAPATVDAVLATVNGNNITQATYDRNLAARPANAKRERPAIIEELIKRELLLQEALKQGMDKQPEVIREIATLRENILVASAIKAVADNIASSDEELQKFYTAHIKEMITTEYKARHILVPTAEEAKAIIADLDKGSDFATLAKEKSKDNAAEGGDLGWFSGAQMVKPFAEAIATLPKGKYTAEPVKSEFGWHVILREDTRESTPPPFAEVKDRIKMAVQRIKIQEYIQNLRNQAQVEIKN